LVEAEAAFLVTETDVSVYPLVNIQIKHTKSDIENGPVERVDLPIKNGGSFHCFISLAEGNLYGSHFHPIASGIINELRSKMEFPPLFQEQLVSDFIGGETGRSMEWW
jgi:hypothetical protein